VGEPFGIGHDDSVWKLAFKPDGHVLVSANDSALYVWDLRDSHRVGVPISGSKKNMLAIAFNPEGTMLAGGGDDDNLYIWDTSTNEARLEKTIQVGSRGIWDIAFSPRGDIFTSGGRDGAITLWQSKALSSIPNRLIASNGQVSSIAIGSDGATLLAGYEDGTIIVWNMDSGARLGEPIKHGSGLDHVALSLDLKLIAAGGTGEPLALWDITSHEKVHTLSLTDFDSVSALLYTPDHRFLISIQEDYCLLWDMSESDELNHVLVGHTQKIWALASNRSGTVLASGGKDGSVLLWDTVTRRRLDPPLKLSHSYVKALAFHPTKELLAVGHDNGTITIWSVSTREQVAPPLHLHKEPIIALTYSQDGHYLAAGSADGTVAIYDLSGPTEVANYEHDDAISGLDFSRDGRLLASSGDDGKIILWDVLLNRVSRAPIETKPEEADHVRFSPDGDRLAWFDGTRIVLWDLHSPLDQRTYLQGVVDKVNSLAFSSDGSLIASSTMDHQIILWDTKSLQRLPRALQGHTDIVWNAIFLGNRGVVASSSNDLTVRLWDVQTDTWLSRLCEIANRNLSRDEWVQYLGSEPYRKTCPRAP
jgi:WD40 repeat protein